MVVAEKVIAETARATSAGRPLLVFDVNETLLDIDALRPFFADVFGADHMREWFAQTILHSQALSLAGEYVRFDALSAGMLRMLGTIHGVDVTDAAVLRLGEAVASLPVHPEVPAALRRLADAGFDMVTLTNSPPSDGPDALDRAEVGRFFDRRFSVDVVRRFKPASETYRMVERAMDVSPGDACMVAAHAWDTLGAAAVGWRTALLTRGVNPPLPLSSIPQPTLVGPDLAAVAEAIIDEWG